MLCAAEGEIQIFENVDATKKGEGAIVCEGDLAQLDLLRHGLERSSGSREPTGPGSSHQRRQSEAAGVGGVAAEPEVGGIKISDRPDDGRAVVLQ